jgi:hypothetical protein
MAATMADAHRMQQQAAAAELRECDWHRIVREHAAPSVVDQEIRAREASDRAHRERAGCVLPSDATLFEQRLDHERRPSAFGLVRERVAERERQRFEGERRAFFDRPYITFDDSQERTYVFTSTPSEDSTSAGAFRSWAHWQRDYADAMFGHQTASWFERMYSFATDQDPKPEPTEQPTQRVFDGELPEHYIDAGAVGNEVRIPFDDLIDEDDLLTKVARFEHAASIHAPWIVCESLSVERELRFGYARPCLTDLPA